VLGALKRKFFGNHKQSKTLAKSRLHFVLVQDRSGLTNEELAAFRGEICDVLERYFVIDKQAFDISYERDAETSTLLINSPLIVNRRQAPGGEVGARRGKKGKSKQKPSTAAAGA